MGGFSGPNDVSDGLVLLLDAANQKSYPGSGNVWYDLSGRGNHFDLINSPVVVDNFFDFSTDEYAQKTISTDSGVNILAPDLVPVNESFTIEVIYRFENDTAGKKFIGTGNYGAGGWNIGVGSSNFNNINFSAYSPDCEGTNCRYNRGNIGYNRTNNTIDFIYIQVTYNVEETTSTMYINGELVTSLTSSRVTGTGPNAPFFRIGANVQGGWQSMKGYCGMVRFYNRALTDNEVKQNFDSFSKRYDI